MPKACLPTRRPRSSPQCFRRICNWKPRGPAWPACCSTWTIFLRGIRNMNDEDLLLQFETRRHFFNRCGVGLGKLALLSLLNEGRAFSATPAAVNPMQAKPGHFPAKAKNVIYLFM